MEKTLYPKTVRIKNEKVVITEKLDGSNLGIFKLNGELIIAQRNHCFKFSELNTEYGSLYKGLFGWIKENHDKLDLCEGSGVFGEWIGMGKIGYDFDKRFYIFAKANIDENLEVRNINYDRKLFIYPFESQSIPDCIGVVPKVDYEGPTDIDSLNTLYDKYCSELGRQVEGFIINNNNQISKYVRYKNGKLTEHKII